MRRPMEYSINRLTKITGVTARTLRYYDEIGLLKPARIKESGYRIYSEREVLILRCILIYRELGLSLDDIRCCLEGKEAGKEMLLTNLDLLRKHKQRIEALMDNIEVTLADMQTDGSV